MSTTLVSDVSEQVQKFWAPMLKDELFETNVLATLVNKDYEGVIKRGGDTGYVSMIQHPTAQRKTIGAGADTFASQKMVTTRVGIVADQRISASFELEDMVDLQTQLGSPEGKSKIRQVLLEAMGKELNAYLYSLVSPSNSAPDHTITGVTDFNATQLLALKTLAGQAKWAAGERYVLVDPQYHADLLASQTLISSDFVSDAPVIGGQMVAKRYGFNIIEDNSEALLGLGTGSADAALAFHPDFLYLVMGEPTFKLSDLHSNKQFGYLLSVDMWCGAKLGIEGDVKHISVINA